MNVHQILINDNNPEHRELSIYRTGQINRVKLEDITYTSYNTIAIDAHDYAAFFYYGVAEALNKLPFLSESSNGLDSWDEAFLHNSTLLSMNSILDEAAALINPDKNEKIMLGWQDEPVRVAYYREIDPLKFLSFIRNLKLFVAESEHQGYDLEFIL
ncbi:MAG: hypothetical protein WCL43_07700 [Chlorobium sp.]|jgi:hypothetical protein|nr:MAG: hypothetical protein FDX12_09320 [Chlorobium sp.]